MKIITESKALELRPSSFSDPLIAMAARETDLRILCEVADPDFSDEEKAVISGDLKAINVRMDRLRTGLPFENKNRMISEGGPELNSIQK